VRLVAAVTARILVACSPGEQRVAVVQDATLLDYALDRPGAPDGVGDLHRGRIATLVPAMAGAFVVLDGAEGFLPDSDGAKGRTQGEAIGVRITRAAQGGKGPRLTAKLSPQDASRIGTGPPALLARGPSAVYRARAARYPAAAVQIDDPAAAAALRQTLGERLSIVAAAFDPDIEADIELLAETDVTLPDGVRLSIHPTPALVAIDVDAGATTAERRGKAAQQWAVNQAMLPALARQIRLRNLSGAIVVDLAGLTPRRRVALAPALAAALAADPLQPKFLGFTALGLAEIVRPRIHPPLHELTAGPHAAGLTALRRIAQELHVDPRRLPVLRASPAVVTALQQDTVALADLARRAGRALMLRSDPSLPTTGWIMEAEHG
jgi:Ribonuclease G/E